MARKLATFLAALLLPGGLVALFGLWALELASRTPRGQRMLAGAKAWAPASMLALPAWLPISRR